jgi:hypothetical protein
MQDAAFIEVGQIRKGAPKNEMGHMGKDLPYFRVVFNEGEEETAALFAEEFPEKPTEIEIMFPFDEPWRVWEYGLEAYTGRGIRIMLVNADTDAILYWTDPRTGEAIVRNGIWTGGDKKGEAATWDGETPAYSYTNKKGELKHVMPTLRCRLRVMIPELKRIVYFTVISGSWYDKANITRQLTAYYQMTGSLKGIPFLLRRRWQEVPCARPDGGRVRDRKSLISVESTEEWSIKMFDALKTWATPDAGRLFGAAGEPVRQDDEHWEPEEPMDNLGPPEYMGDDGSESPFDGTSDEYAIGIGAEIGLEAEQRQEPAGWRPTPTRPLDPQTLKNFLLRKAGDDKTPATERQIPFVARKLQEAFAPAADAVKRYHMTLTWLWGVDNAVMLTKTQARATLDWLLDKDGPNDTGDTPLHEHAPDEAARVYAQTLKDAGQGELAL